VDDDDMVVGDNNDDDDGDEIWNRTRSTRSRERILEKHGMDMLSLYKSAAKDCGLDKSKG